MLYIKKLLSVILSVSITIVLLTGAVLAESPKVEVEEMAEALNKLNILQGSNGDFLLNNLIDRAQAATLIIRMLGKDEYVRENADDLRYTKYEDVSPEAWYASYIGYSTEHSIVGGNPDGSFTPLDYVTEKAFIKMSLCALGYIYGEDFDWTNVYQKAYEIGIVKDPSYETRIQDDTDYLRSEAVELLYHALNTNKKGTQTKMAYTLVEEDIMTVAELAASGIFADETKTEINTISVLAPNSVEVVFNEVIQSVSVDDVKITDIETDSELGVKSVGLSDNSIQIITAGQTPGYSYNVEINAVIDVEGNISGKLSGTFIGYKSAEVTSDFFKVKKIEQASENVINIFYTHPINANGEISSYYEILEDGKPFISGTAQDLSVKRIQAVDNAVSLVLKEKKLTSGSVYTLNVNGRLTSSLGVKLGEGKGEKRDFVATVAHQGSLEILSVTSATENSVRVRFNREVDMAWAGKRLNYGVVDPDGRMIDVIEVVASDSSEYLGKEIYLKLNKSLVKSDTYKLKIEYIPDLYKLSTIEEVELSFPGEYPREVPLAIKRIINENNNTIEIIFNKPLDPESAVKVSNFLIRGNNDTSVNTEPIKAYYSEQNGEYSIKLFLPSRVSFSNKKKYWIHISGLKDKMGEGGQLVYQKEFTANRVEAGKPKIVDAVTISKDTVKLAFDVEIAFTPTNISIDNYTLQYEYNDETLRMVPIAVNYINADTLVLRFDELNPAMSYKLIFDNMTDYSEVYTRTSDDGDNMVDVRFGG
jgi:hypothetical protein